MKKSSLPQFIGVITSLLVIWLINDLTLVDDCINQGGSFDYQTGKCLLGNGEVYTTSYSKYLIALYFFIGLIVALLVTKVTRKLTNISQE